MLDGEVCAAPIAVGVDPDWLHPVTGLSVVHPLIVREEGPIELMQGHGDPYIALPNPLKPLLCRF